MRLPPLSGGWGKARFFGKSDLYTIHAVAQDDFSDVPMPDMPKQPETVKSEILKATTNTSK